MKNENLKLVTLNIEADKHLKEVTDFLKVHNADVICLQEVFEKDVPHFKNLLEMDGKYAPTMFIKYSNEVGFTPGNNYGLLLLTKFHPVKIDSYYYVGAKDNIPIYIDKEPNSCARVLLVAEFKKDNRNYRIMTTHFTWSPAGKSTDLQHKNIQELFSILGTFDEYILCGDFNVPRGGDIWELLAQRYTDNIPLEVKTTIDPNLHRVKNLKFVVDGVFSTPGFKVEDVQVISGISDHKAIVAHVRLD